MGWISVEDRLPEDVCRCWCYVEESWEVGDSHYQWNYSYNPIHGFNSGRDTVTHWQPLPEPPK